MLVYQANALKSLRREYQRLKEREKNFGDILGNLRSRYNPNYQDMAVLEAVRGWEQLANLPHINEAGKVQQEVTDEEAGIVSDEAEEDEEREEGAWSREELETDLDSLLQTDYETLLLAHDEHMDSQAETSSCSFPSTFSVQPLKCAQYFISLIIFQTPSWRNTKN